MVCNRLISPSSKREASEWIKGAHESEWENLELHHFYRALDQLIEEEVEAEMFYVR